MGSAEWGSDSASFASTPRCRSRPPASASVAPPKPSSRTIGRPLARLPRVAAHETTPPPPLPRTDRSALAPRRLLFFADVAHQGQARPLRDLADRRPGGRRPPKGQRRHDARGGRGRPRQTHRSPIPRRQGRPRGGCGSTRNRLRLCAACCAAPGFPSGAAGSAPARLAAGPVPPRPPTRTIRKSFSATAPSCAARRHPRLARDDRRPINGPIGCRGPIPPRRPPPRRKKFPAHGVSRLHARPKVGCDDHCRVAPLAGSPQIPSP